MKKEELDSYLHKGKRKRLLEELKKAGINDQVLEAMNKVPRHLFMDSAFVNLAYENKAFPIGEGQTISQPYTVGYQTELLGIKKGDKVLEIGTGSGYQTAVLIEMGAKVISIERQQKLFEKASRFLPSIGYSARFIYGDGYKGYPSQAPYDKIIVTAGAPFVPEDLLVQLKENGGTMVIPVNEGNYQIMNRIVRKTGTEFDKQVLGKFSFVPLLEDKA